MMGEAKASPFLAQDAVGEELGVAADFSSQCGVSQSRGRGILIAMRSVLIATQRNSNRGAARHAATKNVRAAC